MTGRIALIIVLLAGVLYGASWLLTPYSGIARAVAWMESDTGDWRRFPARPMVAPAEPYRFVSRPTPAELETIEIPGRRPQDLDRFLTSTATTSFLVLRDDELLLEWYGNGSHRGSIRTSFSMAKSWLSALVGIAIADGAIGGPDDPVTAYVPELLARDPRFERITLRHLLSMSSGLRYEEQGLPWSDDARTYYATDMRELALEDTEVVEPPGRTWLYNNYNPLLVGLVVERAVGMPVAEYLEQRIWQRIGMEFDGSWSLDSEGSGFEKMESGINARAVDFAKFGRLFLNRGSWEGASIISEAWVAESTSASRRTDPASHYQYFWWVDDEPGADGAFMARGKYAQYVYVAPAQGLVFVRLGDEEGYEDWPGLFRSLADRLGPA